MRNVSDERYKEIKTRILCSIILFVENHAACEIIWKNMVEPDSPHMAVGLMLDN
jgi:hypothetical protein